MALLSEVSPSFIIEMMMICLIPEYNVYRFSYIFHVHVCVRDFGEKGMILIHGGMHSVRRYRILNHASEREVNPDHNYYAIIILCVPKYCYHYYLSHCKGQVHWSIPLTHAK